MRNGDGNRGVEVSNMQVVKAREMWCSMMHLGMRGTSEGGDGILKNGDIVLPNSSLVFL